MSFSITVSMLLLGIVLWSIILCNGQVISDDDIPELAYLDTTVDPCEDFYQFSCGNFHNIYEIPDGDDHVNHFTILEKKLIRVGNEILERPKSVDDPQALKKVKSAYKACLNTQYANTMTMTVPELRIVDEWNGMPMISETHQTENFTWNEIGKIAATYSVPLLLYFQILQQLDNSDGFMILIRPDPLQQVPSAVRPSLRKNYDQIIEETFQNYGTQRVKLGLSLRSTTDPFHILIQTIAKNVVKTRNPFKTDAEIDADINKVMQFWTTLAQGGIVEDGIEIPAFSSPYQTLADLQNWTTTTFGNSVDLNWVEYFQNLYGNAGVQITDDLLTYPASNKMLYGVLNLIRQTDPNIVKNFALLRVFLFLAPDSDQVTRQAFDDYIHSQNYTVYPRWEYCTRKLLDITTSSDTASLSFAVTYEFQKLLLNYDKYFEASKLVELLQASLRKILKEAKWMDVGSRQAALTKADNMLVLFGFPDFVSDKEKIDKFYRNLRICEWDNYGNAHRVRAFKQAYINSQLGKSRNRSFWDKSTFDTNAYYNRNNNKIILPVSMLNPPYFQGTSILDLARLGTIVGHEFTHGFDSEGQKYNEVGNYGEWWTTVTTAAFTEKAQCFIEQYNQYYISETDSYVNGSTSLNENLADNGGLRGGYLAFLEAIERTPITVKSNYTFEQLFFIGYGTSWCSNENLSYITSYNPSYAPNRYRVNGPISNMKEFSKAFQCKRGSTMNPKTQCVLW